MVQPYSEILLSGLKKKNYMITRGDLKNMRKEFTHEAHCHSQDSEHTHFPTVSLVTVDYFAFSRILYEWNHILYCVNSFRIFFRSPLVIM